MLKNKFFYCCVELTQGVHIGQWYAEIRNFRGAYTCMFNAFGHENWLTDRSNSGKGDTDGVCQCRTRINAKNRENRLFVLSAVALTGKSVQRLFQRFQRLILAFAT